MIWSNAMNCFECSTVAPHIIWAGVVLVLGLALIWALTRASDNYDPDEDPDAGDPNS